MTATTAGFKMIPERDQLARMPRDLRFHPSANAHPRALTAAQIEAFNRDGYLRPIRIYSDEEITTLRGYFDDLLARVIAAGGDSYSISTAHLKYGRVYDILTEPRIVAVVKDVLGENVVAWGSHFFCKMPNDGKQVAWHQDASYWPLSPSKAVTVWLAIDDADVENACMRFVSGSHHYGHLTYRPSSPAEHNVLDQTIEDVEQYGTPVDDVLKAGEASLHSDLLLHGSEANNSDRRRCGLTLRYCAADVRAEMDWNQKGVIVSGSDPSGHWANPPRPATD
jgi:ectoine hydroxylase-related dioxygenase (phytanoyl-CoA dioxygenase family)